MSTERDPSTYAHEGQQRLLKVIQTLAGHEINGKPPGEIAKELACSASCITRDLANLQLAGMAELVPETSRWRLSPVLVQIALKHMASMGRAESRLAETRERFSRS